MGEGRLSVEGRGTCVFGRSSAIASRLAMRGSAVDFTAEGVWFVGCGLTGRGAQRVEGGDELALIRAGLAEGDFDPPYAHRDPGADLQ